MRTRALAAVLVGVIVAHAAPGAAWEIETHVGLTQRAAMASQLDRWLRAQGLAAGMRDGLALEMRVDKVQKIARPVRAEDRGLLDELSMLDSALGVAPDGARQPALSWLLAGAALEGARIDRIRHHFVDPRRGFGADHATGLIEGGAAARIGGLGTGLGSLRGVLTGASFDGTGDRADRWMDAPVAHNPLSRRCMLDELYTAATAPEGAVRAAALAHALLCAGAVLHVLEAVGDPAHARGDFAVNHGVARAPLARWAALRYGLSVPAPMEGAVPRVRLAAFVTTSDERGLADEVARSFVSPGTMPSSARALPLPALTAGREPQGSLAGPSVAHLVAYERMGGEHVRYTLPANAIAEAVDALLPRIAADATLLLDFLLRGSLRIEVTPAVDRAPLKVTVHDGQLALGPGQIELFLESRDGVRRRVQGGPTQGTKAGNPMADFELGSSVTRPTDDQRVIAVFRGTDENAEPIVLSVSSAL